MAHTGKESVLRLVELLDLLCLSRRLLVLPLEHLVQEIYHYVYNETHKDRRYGTVLYHHLPGMAFKQRRIQIVNGIFGNYQHCKESEHNLTLPSHQYQTYIQECKGEPQIRASRYTSSEEVSHREHHKHNPYGYAYRSDIGPPLFGGQIRDGQ